MPTRERISEVDAESSGETAGGLGTFAGVFTPSVLTILGIILFLRLGYVTGAAGIGRALVIIGIASLISVLTSQSLAAIATNLHVKGGGDYYLISRTLGHQFGGAIGTVLYLAQSVSVAFYCIGFAEALCAMIQPLPWLTPRLVAFCAVGLLFVLAWLGADWATRFQYVVMALLAAALFSFFAGGAARWDASLLARNWSAPADGPPFWVIFGIFFPAVTGFTQGVSMSGDLRDPGKSLPLGTFLAVGVSIVVYFAVALVFAGVLPNQVMMNDYQAIKKVARYEFLIDAGVIAATLSSAMASFLGGPRILQSMAADRIFPALTPFAKGSGPAGNPRRAVMATLGIAMVTILLGQLNLVARVVSMFFLISYGLLNYATYYEAGSQSPSFRPRFRWFNAYLSLAGCLLCLGTILALDFRDGIIALAILLAIQQYLKRTAGPSRWADSSSAHHFQVIRGELQEMSDQPEHHRNWRPHLLVFTHPSRRRLPLLTFARWIEGGSGLITAVQVIEGTGPRRGKLFSDARADLQHMLRSHDIGAFPLVVQSDDIPSALPMLLQSYGIGPLRANTAVVNWYGKSGAGLGSLEALRYGHYLHTIYRWGMNLVVLHFDATRWEELNRPEAERSRIDVWWRADASSRLMLLLAYLMTRHPDWRKARIRVLTDGTGEHLAQVQEDLRNELEDIRIDAEPLIVEDFSPATVTAASRRSSLVFLPFRIRQYRFTDVNGLSLDRTLLQLPPTALLMAAEEIDLDAEPEEGIAGELAAAMDRLGETERRAAKSAKALQRAQEEVEALKRRLQSGRADGLEGEDMKEMEDLLKSAEEMVQQAFRKNAKNDAKVEDAAQAVRALGGPTTGEVSG